MDEYQGFDPQPYKYPPASDIKERMYVQCQGKSADLFCMATPLRLQFFVCCGGNRESEEILRLSPCSI